MLQKKQKTIAIVAIISLVAGLALQFFANPTSVENQQQCREAVEKLYGDKPEVVNDFVQRCANDAGFITMMAAKSGDSAEVRAQNIARVNQTSILGNSLSLFLIGFGICALIGAVITGRKKK